MKSLLLASVVLCLIGSPSLAGKNAGGALVVHVDDAYHPTWFPPPDPCGYFGEYLPGTCEELITTSEYIDPMGLSGTYVCLVAALPENSDPGVSVIYFGLEHNFPQGYIGGWEFCGPAGSFEIPDSGWPDDWQNAGNSLAFGAPVTGDRLFPFYWLGVYGDVGNYIGTRINPTGGYAAFVSDDNPGVLDEILLFGQLRWFEEVYNECPTGEIPGACCRPDGTCDQAFEDDCTAAGDQWIGPDVPCDPNPCPTAVEEKTWGSVKAGYR